MQVIALLNTGLRPGLIVRVKALRVCFREQPVFQECRHQHERTHCQQLQQC